MALDSRSVWLRGRDALPSRVPLPRARFAARSCLTRDACSSSIPHGISTSRPSRSPGSAYGSSAASAPRATTSSVSSSGRRSSSGRPSSRASPAAGGRHQLDRPREPRRRGAHGGRRLVLERRRLLHGGGGRPHDRARRRPPAASRRPRPLGARRRLGRDRLPARADRRGLSRRRRFRTNRPGGRPPRPGPRHAVLAHDPLVPGSEVERRGLRPVRFDRASPRGGCRHLHAASLPERRRCSVPTSSER